MFFQNLEEPEDRIWVYHFFLEGRVIMNVVLNDLQNFKQYFVISGMLQCLEYVDEKSLIKVIFRGHILVIRDKFKHLVSCLTDYLRAWFLCNPDEPEEASVLLLKG
jgi:hypothetical protein